jgi:adenosylhomocysteine nucleosidase
MLALVAAMKQEIMGLKRHMQIENAVSENGYKIFQGTLGDKEILLVQTGIGKERTEKALKVVLKNYHVTALISFGLAGGLSSELNVGDIVISSKLYSTDRQSFPYHSDTNLLSLALQNPRGDIVRMGKIVTTAQVASEPDEKRSLGLTYDADVVDMESYWIAKVADENKVPFLAIRGISDTYKEKLPPFEQLLEVNGRLRLLKVILFFLSHPGQIILLARLYQNSKRSEANLANFIARFIERSYQTL